MNIKNLIHKSVTELNQAGIKNPELEARVLLEHAILEDNTFVFSHPEYLITNAQYSKFRRYIRRRKTGEPVAYILGQKEFFGLNFLVNKNVLIPRPETEWLVEEGTKYFKNQLEIVKSQQLTVLDMGTGSGCIIISLIKNLLTSDFQFSIDFYACDNSKKAIVIAKKNSRLHSVENYVHFYFSSLFENRKLPQKFDLILANLPYVPYKKSKAENEKMKIQNGINFEPQTAIFADDNGTAIIRDFLYEAKKRIKPDGLILLEVDCKNAKIIYQFAKKEYPNAKIKIVKDLAHLDRYIIIKK